MSNGSIFRIAMPVVQGRGAGLGNALIPWAKAFLAAIEIGGIALHPAWGLNRRRYWRDFGTSRLDWIGHAMLRLALPRFRFSEADFRATGEDDFGFAVRQFVQSKGIASKRAFVLEIEGMWGGFPSIDRARPFVLANLLRTQGTLLALARHDERRPAGKLVVAVHVRLSDFAPAVEPSSYRGRFNISLPLDWYLKTARSLKRVFGTRVAFMLFSDGDENQLAPLTRVLEPINHGLPSTAAADIVMMAQADLLVCSVSSFSVWGAFLSDAPYIWFEPNLADRNGLLSIWGDEPSQREPSGLTTRNSVYVCSNREDGAKKRGFPVGLSGEVNYDLIDALEARISIKNDRTDLIRYGVVAIPGVSDRGLRHNAEGRSPSGLALNQSDIGGRHP